MKSAFPGYFPPNDGEFKDIWGTGLFVLDANAILNLYRYSHATRGEFLSVLTELKDRLWIPAQVAEEFLRNRFGVIQDQKSAYDGISKEFDKYHNGFEETLRKYSRHPTLDTNRLLDQYRKAMKKLRHELELSEKAHNSSFVVDYGNDEILTEVTGIFEGKVGPKYSDKDLESILVEGSKRYADEIPPGYKDADKKGGRTRKFGDLILWKQLLSWSKGHPNPVIFITDDRKEDWWNKNRAGQNLGPRPELVEEHFAITGKRIHFYTSEEFLRRAKKTLKSKISAESVKEIKEITAADAAWNLRTQLLGIQGNDLLRNYYAHFDVTNAWRESMAKSIEEMKLAYELPDYKDLISKAFPEVRGAILAQFLKDLNEGRIHSTVEPEMELPEVDQDDDETLPDDPEES